MITKVVEETVEKSISYPCIGRDKTNQGLYVLFTGDCVGTQLTCVGTKLPSNHVGHHSKRWYSINFWEIVPEVTIHFKQELTLKAIVVENVIQKCITYPCVGRNKRIPEMYVLFTEDGVGTQLTCNDVGYYTTSWASIDNWDIIQEVTINFRLK